MPRNSEIPLCVDLDGTLINTDILWESFLILLKSKPWMIFFIPFIIIKGKAFLKHWIARQVDIDVQVLPYHEKFLAYLKTQKRPLYLATASHEKYAKAIADHLGIFKGVFASTATNNLSGNQKRKTLEKKFGQRWGYAGNASVDCKLWDHAMEIIMVNVPTRLIKKYPAPLVFNNQQNLMRILFKAIRIHQWAKNFLIFIPLIMSHNFLNISYLADLCLAFLAFGLSASSVYILNDLLDLESDRHHQKKRYRAFASGQLSILKGILIIPILLTLSATIAFSLSGGFGYALLIYFITTTAYSFFLKSIAIVDVIVLGFLYTIRIIAGGLAANIPNTHWLLAFSFFLFVSLAFVKRFSELKSSPAKGDQKIKGRGYYTDDLEQISSFGTASGYLSILILALYLNSNHARELYANATMLWLICPVFLYWISRIWLLARRGIMIEDPVRFTISDPVSYFVVVLIGIVLLIAKYPFSLH